MKLGDRYICVDIIMEKCHARNCIGVPVFNAVDKLIIASVDVSDSNIQNIMRTVINETIR